MNPDRWQKIEEIFHAALERDANERSVFVKNACQGDENLFSEVKKFISAHEEANDFIQKPIFSEAVQLLTDQNETSSLIGKSFNHYKIVSRLGVGGMGEIYLAHDLKLNRNVALKVLLPEIAKDKDRVRRFKLEAKAVSALNHPNIVTIFEIGEAENQFFIVYEFVDGKTLREKIARNQLTVLDAVKTTEQIADALSAAHQAGIIHRDIKPENVMIRQDGYVKVLDFGLAKLLRIKDLASKESSASESSSHSPLLNPYSSNPSKITQPGLIFGSIQYMSPEQARGLETDERTDIWSLGVVLYEMLTGKNPFAGETISDSIGAILHIEPEFVNKNIPEHLQKIIEKSLKKGLAERYQNIGEFAEDLTAVREILKNYNSNPRIGLTIWQEKTVELAKQTTDENPSLIQETANQDLQVKTKESELNVQKKHRKWLLIPLAIVVCLLLFFFYNYFHSYIFPPSQNLADKNNNPPVSKSDKSSGIWTYNPQTKESKQLTSDSQTLWTEEGLGQMPDGRLLYAKQNNNEIQIFVSDENGSNEKQLTSVGEKNIKPIATADGKYILYFSAKNNSNKIMRMNVDGSNPVQLAETTDIESGIQVTPDSKTVVFAQTGNKSHLMKTSIESGKSIPLFPESEMSDSFPRISPNGKYLAYLSKYFDKASGQFKELVTIVEFNKGEGGEPIFEEEFDFASTLQWSPDSKSLCFIKKQVADNLWCYSIADNKETGLTNFDSGKILNFTWSRDGKKLFLGRSLSEK